MRDYYTTGEAAKLLGVCVRTIQVWAEQGTIISRKTDGGHRRLSKNSVDAIRKEKFTSARNQSSTLSNNSNSILIVDDSKSDSYLTQKVVRKAFPDAKIVEAADGYEALLKIGQLRPQIIFLDLRMPHMDGFQVLDTLQRNSSLVNQIYVCTSYSEAEIANYGTIPEIVTRVFHKPIDVKLMIDVLTENSPFEAIR